MREPMTSTAASGGSQPSNLSESTFGDTTSGAAHVAHVKLVRLVEGHVAQLVQVLDADCHPVMSREEAVRLELLPEWEHLGLLCVCREVLPPMPRWLPRSMATHLLADAEARCSGSSILHLIGVEFTDGFVTAVEREELHILPL